MTSRNPRSNRLMETNKPQIDRFKELARELECDEDESAFDAALKRITEAKPTPASQKSGKARRSKSSG